VVVRFRLQWHALAETAATRRFRWRRYGWAITEPLPVSNAANKLVVPLRT
jgi:hypothetical protein